MIRFVRHRHRRHFFRIGPLITWSTILTWVLLLLGLGFLLIAAIVSITGCASLQPTSETASDIALSIPVPSIEADMIDTALTEVSTDVDQDSTTQAGAVNTALAIEQVAPNAVLIMVMLIAFCAMISVVRLTKLIVRTSHTRGMARIKNSAPCDDILGE